MRGRDGGISNTEKRLGYEVQESLLDILEREDTLVKQLNTAKHALVLASKTSSRLTEYKKDVEVLEKKLSEARRDLQLYFLQLGVNISGVISNEEQTSGQAYVKREKLIESLYE